MQDPSSSPRLMPQLGCAGIALAVLLLFLMPLLLVDVMHTALQRLHLSPSAALLAVIGILLGGLINIPVHRIEREEEQPVEFMAVFGLWGFVPQRRRVRRETIIAVNFGGCVVPTSLAAWQLLNLLGTGGRPWTALCIVAAVNIFACYRAAQPVRGVGIMMPGFLSPLIAVGLTWLLLGGEAYEPYRAPVAFTAGVLGPLVGADLLRLKDISRMSTGVLSIGGAGTFDGIVLSGVLAALLA